MHFIILNWSIKLKVRRASSLEAVKWSSGLGLGQAERMVGRHVERSACSMNICSTSTGKGAHTRGGSKHMKRHPTLLSSSVVSTTEADTSHTRCQSRCNLDPYISMMLFR